METLTKKLRDDLKTSLKIRETFKSTVIRGILSQLNYEEIRLRRDCTPEEELVMLARVHKQTKEQLDGAELSKRDDLISAAKAELEIIETYLPPPLTETEVLLLARTALISTNSKTVKDMGKVMKYVQPIIKGRFDGKRAAEIVKNMLTGARVINP